MVSVNSCTRQRGQVSILDFRRDFPLDFITRRIIYYFLEPFVRRTQRTGPGVDTRPNGTRYRVSVRTRVHPVRYGIHCLLATRALPELRLARARR